MIGNSGDWPYRHEDSFVPVELCEDWTREQCLAKLREVLCFTERTRDHGERYYQDFYAFAESMTDAGLQRLTAFYVAWYTKAMRYYSADDKQKQQRDAHAFMCHRVCDDYVEMTSRKNTFSKLSFVEYLSLLVLCSYPERDLFTLHGDLRTHMGYLSHKQLSDLAASLSIFGPDLYNAVQAWLRENPGHTVSDFARKMISTRNTERAYGSTDWQDACRALLEHAQNSKVAKAKIRKHVRNVLGVASCRVEVYWDSDVAKRYAVVHPEGQEPVTIRLS